MHTQIELDLNNIIKEFSLLLQMLPFVLLGYIFVIHGEQFVGFIHVYVTLILHMTGYIFYCLCSMSGK